LSIAQHEIDTESWLQMRHWLRQKEGPRPSIEEDLAALEAGDARRAGPRLIDRGPEVLGALHAALVAPETQPRYAQSLLQVIRPIGHESSVPVLLDLLRDDPTTPLRRDILLALCRLPVTDDAADFIRELARDDHEPWSTRRMAYSWYGLQRDPRGRALAEALRWDPDVERRSIGLYVLARLGDASVLEPLGQILEEGAPSGLRDLLMLSLAELVTPEEFERRAPSALSWSMGYQDGLLLTRYRAAEPHDRPPFCIRMLRAHMPEYQRIGVRCLLDSGYLDDLLPHAALDLEAPGRAAILRNEIRKAGWRVIDTETEFRIEKQD
jgi:hypothetical protein